MMMENRVVWIIGLIFLITMLNVVEWGFNSTPVETSEYASIDGDYIVRPDGSNPEAIEQQLTGGGANPVAPWLDFMIINIEGAPFILTMFLTLVQALALLVCAWIIITFILEALPFVGS